MWTLQNMKERHPGWRASQQGLLGIGVGIAVLLWPSISALGLLYMIAAYAIAIGITIIGSATWLPLKSGDTFLVTLSGICSHRSCSASSCSSSRATERCVLLALIAAFSPCGRRHPG